MRARKPICLWFSGSLFSLIMLAASQHLHAATTNAAITDAAMTNTPMTAASMTDTRVLEVKASSLSVPPNIMSDLSDYRSTPGVYGTITSIGSDTLAGLMAIWAQRFQELYPHVKFQIQATGSATASQALTQGTASIGPMSRELSPQEISEFVKVHGYEPTAMVVAIDAIALYVEKNNPVERLSLAQVDALFSVTRLCGAKAPITRWDELGVSKFGQNRAIQLFGRNSASGTYDLFKQSALCDGDFLRNVNEMPSSSSIVQSVASSVGGIGYAALGYKNTNVKTLAISASTNDTAKTTESTAESTAETNTFYAPNPENLRAGKYPFSRNLYLIVNKAPDSTLATLERTFLRFVLSQEGQTIVEQNGYYSVSDQMIQRQLFKIGPPQKIIELNKSQ